MKDLPIASGRCPSRRGFTLIELLIVVVIIGILAMVAVPKYAHMRDRASRGALMSDLRNLATAQEGHFFERNTYSTETDSLNFRSTTGVVVTIVQVTPNGWSASANRPGMASTCYLSHGSAAPIVAGARADKIHCE